MGFTVSTHAPRWVARAITCGVLLLLPACQIPLLRPPSPGAPLPASYNGTATPDNSAQLRIEEFFNDPVLVGLIYQGLGGNQELKILEPLRGKVPPEVFTTPFANPVGGNAENVRNNLREATRLLKEAGFEVKDRKLVDASGKPVTIEILVQDPSAERIALFYKPSLERIGVTVSIRVVDAAQYEQRTRSFDFDMITDVWGESLSPGNEQREFWGSQSADAPGSRNTIGIKNPAIDALIEKVIFATDRASLEAATRALDRVLLWNHYVIPQWTYGKQRTARWDRFGRPDMARLVQQTRRTGWYYRVIEAGTIGEGDDVLLVARPHPSWPLWRLIGILYDRTLDAGILAGMLALPLTPSWQRLVNARLARRAVEDWGARIDGPPRQG